MVVTIDNPPVNAISAEIRAGLEGAASALASEPAIDRIIVTGTGKFFAAGADAREFDLAPREPHLPDVIAAIEASRTPWIAALNGPALGGGAEIALGCRYRIAAPGMTFGLPEVNLGVVPGAGGTQRLARLAGIKTAIDVIALARTLDAREALEAGVVDEIAVDPLDAALRIDIGKLRDRAPLSQYPAPQPDDEATRRARDEIARRQSHQVAPPRALELILASQTIPFGDAIRKERAAFLELRGSPQAKSLRHAFFAERRAKPPPDIVDQAPLAVRKAVVVGGGNMGASIAYALDGAGVSVTIVENDASSAERARANVSRLAEEGARRGRISPQAAAAVKSRIGVVTDYSGLEEADLAIEAAFESLDVKTAVFKALEAALPARAILASNTSYLDLNQIAAATADPGRVIGLHFFSPAHIMKLLEIVRGEASNPAALATGFAIARALKKIPVLAGVCDGFIGNRILARYREAADTLLMDGATPWQIDEAMVEFGYPMGPYEAQDLSGLDIAYANRQRQIPTRDPNRRYIPISDRMVQEGRLGRKTAVGWYRYPGGSKIIDPLIEDLIAEEAWFAKVKRREFTNDEIRVRLLAAMINEAANILDEGIARGAEDIDLVTMHGYAFPRWRGGLMFHADELGPETVLSQVRTYASEDPIVWRPSPLLERIAGSGGRFADLGSRGERDL